MKNQNTTKNIVAVLVTACVMTSVAYYAQAKTYGNDFNSNSLIAIGSLANATSSQDKPTEQTIAGDSRTCIFDGGSSTLFCGDSADALIWALRTDWKENEQETASKQATGSPKVNSNSRYVRKGHNAHVEELIRLEAQKQGYSDIELALDIADCESRFNPKATGVNKDGTRDRGVFQINEYWHKNISDACAYDANCNIEYAIKLLNQGKAHLWSCYRKVR